MPIETNRSVKARVAELDKYVKSDPGGYHEGRARMALAWCLFALDRADEALPVVEPLFRWSGSDSEGNALDFFARDSLALAWLIHDRRGRKTAADKAQKALRNSGTAKRWTKLLEPLKDLAEANATHEQAKPEWAMSGFAQTLSEAAARRGLRGEDAKVEAIFDAALSGLRKRIDPGAPKGKPAARATSNASPWVLTPEGLEKRAAGETSAVVADRIRALARHLSGNAFDAFARNLVLAIAVSLVAEGRPAEALSALDGLLKRNKPKGSSGNSAVVFGLSLRARLLREAGDTKAADADVAVLKGLSPGAFHAEPDWAPKELGAVIAEMQTRSRDDALTKLSLRLGEACFILETNGLMAEVRSSYTKKPVDPKTKKRLEGFIADALGEMRKRLAEKVEPAPAKAAPKKAAIVFSTAKEKNKWIKARKEHLANKFSVKSRQSVDDALELACALVAHGRKGEARDVLDQFADVEYAGDFNVWGPISFGIALRATLLREAGEDELAARDAKRLLEKPFHVWPLDDQLDRLKNFAAKLPQAQADRSLKSALSRLSTIIGWCCWWMETNALAGRVAKSSLDQQLADALAVVKQRVV